MLRRVYVRNARRYINRCLFPGGNKFSVGKTDYEYLQELSDIYPYNPSEEKKFREELDKRKLEEEKERKERERHLLKQEQEQERKEKQKEAAEKRLKKQKEANEAEYKSRLAKYESNPNGVFRAAFVTYCRDYPERCPQDGTKLVVVKNLRGASAKGPAPFCLRCARVFFKPSDYLEGKRKPSKKHFKPKEIKPLEKSVSKQQTKPPDTVSIKSREPGLPASAIIRSRITPRYKSFEEIVIVYNQHEQNSEQGIYWVGRGVSALLMAAIKTGGERRFEYYGKSYKVLSYEEFGDAQKYFAVISRFCDPDAPQSVFVFAHKNISSYQADEFECVTALIPCAESVMPVPVTVYYQKSTHSYFMNETEYTRLRQRYGLPYLRLRTDSPHHINGGFYGLKQHSELNLHGYNVSASSGMSLQTRRKLLEDLICSGVMKKHEVLNHLEWLINSRSKMKNMESAIAEWKSDLQFVSRIDVSKQRIVWVNNFKSKFSAR